MPRIDQETVQRILDAADIVEVVSDYVKLRRSGANYKGLCPFHNERTPSFSVNKARNYCKCFSCGKGGSPVNFIMEMEQMSYNEALRHLARKYNIDIVEKELTDDERQARNKREAMLALNEFALNHFEHNLKETDEGLAIALPYFRHRGINDAMIARFHLGYAIDKGDEFIRVATDAGFEQKYLVETGLAGVSHREGSGEQLYDRYRSRVIFPIHTVSGRVVGFGARTMRTDKNVAKYVNSPESDIYHKQFELYGFYQAKSAIAKADKCIMVEGYLDVISMHQSGVENVVASSGTSLTEGQIRAVRRFTENITLIYDADAAGIKASLRGIRLLLAEKMNVKVLSLPQGEDPDSFAQSHSSSEVEEYLREHETDIIAFMTGVLMKNVNASDPTARAKVVNLVLETVAYVDEPVKRQEYLSQCSRSMAIPEDVLLKQLNIFTARIREENYKEWQRQSARESLAQGSESIQPTEEEEKQEVQQDSAPLLDLTDHHLQPYERELARLLVRYGMCYAADLMDENEEMQPATVYDIIAVELAMDNYTLSDPVSRMVFEAVGVLRYNVFPEESEIEKQRIETQVQAKIEEERIALAQKGGSLEMLERAEIRFAADAKNLRSSLVKAFEADFVRKRFVNSPDDTIRNAANDFISDRYSLSRIYQRTGEVESEQDQLSVLVPRAVNELRAAVLRDRLQDLYSRLKALPPNDVAAATEIMNTIINYQEYQKKLVKALGDRIILPKR